MFKRAYIHAFLFVLLLLCSVACLAETKKHRGDANTPVKIDFFRPEQRGSIIACDIKAETSRTYIVTSKTSGNDGARKQRTLATALKGVMTIIEVSEFGRSAKLEFTIESIECFSNGKPADIDLNGKTLIIDLMHKPLCAFTFKDSNKKVSASDIAFLSIIFRPATKHNLSDIMGNGNMAVRTGDSWSAPVELIKEKLAQRGIKDAKVSGKVSLISKTLFKGVESWHLKALIGASTSGEDFELAITMEVMLPVDAALGGAISISRSGYEKSVKPLPSKSPISDGKSLTVIRCDKMEATLLPPAM